ncbi:cadherin repeat domain-containing protein, partial [bacterium]|nr:cadherin repeat domain-containing protein [bacterium]
RYKGDIYQQIKVNLNHGKLRSKEELKIEIKRQTPIFLEIINHKRTENNEPKVAFKMNNKVSIMSYYDGILKFDNQENQISNYQILGYDGDGDSIIYSIDGGDDAAFFSIDSSGILSFVNPPDFELPLDANQDNKYQVIVKLSQAGGIFTSSQISISVTNVLEVISFDEIADQVKNEDFSDFIIPLSVQDAGFQTTTYFASISDSNIASITLNADRLKIFSIENVSGNATIYVTAEVAGSLYTQSFSLQVNPVNDTPHFLNEKALGWTSLGPKAFTSASIDHLSMKLDTSGRSYVTFSDGNHSSKASVMHYVTNTWKYLGSPGFTDAAVSKNVMAIDSGDTPYVLYQDSSVANAISMKKFNGTTWINVGNLGFSDGAVDHLSLAFDHGNMPYVAFQDQANSNGVTVMKFKDSTWQVVGNKNFSNSSASVINLLFDNNNKLWVSYADASNSGRPTVKTFDGLVWLAKGYSAYTSCTVLAMAIDSQNNIYMAQKYSNYRVYVTKFNGVSSWAYQGYFTYSNRYIDSIEMAFTKDDQLQIAFVDTVVSKKSAHLYRYNASSNYTELGFGNSSDGGSRELSFSLDSKNRAFIAYIDEKNSDKVTVIVSSTANYFVTTQENQLNAAQLESFDVENDALFHSIVGGPDASKFTIDASSGLIQFVSAPDFEINSDSNFDGIYEILVQVSDSNTVSSTKSLSIEITNTTEDISFETLADVTLIEDFVFDQIIDLKVNESDINPTNFTFTTTNASVANISIIAN